MCDAFCGVAEKNLLRKRKDLKTSFYRTFIRQWCHIKASLNHRLELREQKMSFWYEAGKKRQISNGKAMNQKEFVEEKWIDDFSDEWKFLRSAHAETRKFLFSLFNSHSTQLEDENPQVWLGKFMHYKGNRLFCKPLMQITSIFAWLFYSLCF